MGINDLRKSFKEKIRTRQKVFGAWTSIAHPQISEIFCHSHVDFVGIDDEHTSMTLREISEIISSCHVHQTICLPRIGQHNEEDVKRRLDLGADGIIAPQISSIEQVEKFASWMQYPPLGKRSVGVNRAHGYGFEFESYCQTWNDSLVFIAQLETKEAIDACETILSHPFVDAVMLGPYDLSGSYGILGQIEHEWIMQAEEKINFFAHKHQKGCGTQIINITPEEVMKKREKGYSFTVLSSDIFILWKWGEKVRSLVQEMR